MTFQSPSAQLSLLRAPNHPSSMTSISMPSFDASFAMDSSFCVSNSKYVASQLLMRIGLFLSLYAPRIRCFLYSLWNAPVIASNPLSV